MNVTITHISPQGRFTTCENAPVIKVQLCWHHVCIQRSTMDVKNNVKCVKLITALMVKFWCTNHRNCKMQRTCCISCCITCELPLTERTEVINSSEQTNWCRNYSTVSEVKITSLFNLQPDHKQPGLAGQPGYTEAFWEPLVACILYRLFTA